ncbi:hypothetical protein L1887_58904 [Cichorium endivia]|nr:hypothetical protein L1887_58904 [Cichorium endivia]
MTRGRKGREERGGLLLVRGCQSRKRGAKVDAPTRRTFLVCASIVLPTSAHFGERNITHPSNRSVIHARQAIRSCILQKELQFPSSFGPGRSNEQLNCIATQRPAHVRKSLSSTSRREFQSQFGICLSAPQSRVARTTTLPHRRTSLSACIASAHHAAAAAAAAHSTRNPHARPLAP